jgi:hypothetical protein
MKKKYAIFIIITIFCIVFIFVSQGGIVLIDSYKKMESGNHCEAVNLLDQNKKDISQSIFNNIRNQLYEVSLNKCANDTGNNGQSLMKKQYEGLCQSIQPTSPIHPSIGIYDAYPKVWINPEYIDRTLFSTYPSELWSDRPGNFLLALCIKEDYRFIEKCSYTENRIVQRYSVEWLLTLRSIKTSEIIAEGKIIGTKPKECPFIQKFPLENKTINLFGDDPKIQGILLWLHDQTVNMS